MNVPQFSVAVNTWVYINKQGMTKIGLRTVTYYGYGRKFYGPKRVGFSHTRTVQQFLKAWTVRYGHFYGRITVYGTAKHKKNQL